MTLRSMHSTTRILLSRRESVLSPRTMVMTPSIDESIRKAKLDLENTRRCRWENEKKFYSEIEELNCGISLLRSRIQAALDLGGDFNLCQTCMEECNKSDSAPFVGIHFGHQVLLLLAIHQMEVRNNLLKLTARQGKQMVVFLDEAKVKLESENTLLYLEYASKRSQAGLFIVDDHLARKVVAQRLVIRKLRSVLGEEPCGSPNDSMLIGAVVEVPVSPEPIFFLDASCITLDTSCLNLDFSREVSPRNVRSFVPMPKIESDIATIEMQCMFEINGNQDRTWGSLAMNRS